MEKSESTWMGSENKHEWTEGEDEMEKEQMLQQLLAQTNEEKKALFLEQLEFCKFADNYDFENYFRLGELKDSELFCLISFLYHRDCFLMMRDILNRCRERFVSYDESMPNGIDFSEQFLSRMAKFNRLAEC